MASIDSGSHALKAMHQTFTQENTSPQIHPPKVQPDVALSPLQQSQTSFKNHKLSA